MTVAELIELLMAFPLDAEVSFSEFRYQGGGDEWYDCELDFWQRGEGVVKVTPRPDTEYIQRQAAQFDSEYAALRRQHDKGNH